MSKKKRRQKNQGGGPAQPAGGPPQPQDEQEMTLEEEIRSLRSLIRRLGGMAEEKQSLKELALLLNTLGANAARLATLLQVQRSLEEEEGMDMGSAIARALAEMREEMAVDRQDRPAEEVLGWPRKPV
jgi:hypothetical protein